MRNLNEILAHGPATEARRRCDLIQKDLQCREKMEKSSTVKRQEPEISPAHYRRTFLWTSGHILLHFNRHYCTSSKRAIISSTTSISSDISEPKQLLFRQGGVGLDKNFIRVETRTKSSIVGLITFSLRSLTASASCSFVRYLRSRDPRIEPRGNGLTSRVSQPRTVHLTPTLLSTPTLAPAQF